MAVLNRNRSGRLVRGARHAWLAALAAAALLPAVRATEAPPPAMISAEYRVKAGYLFNFPQFVEWPARAFREANAPIVIGVLGDDPFGSYLDELVQGEKIGGHPLVVRRFRRVDDIADCHILFVSRSEAGQFDQIIAHLRDRSVLTVGDEDGFERAGGMVRFVIENNKVRFRINPEAARAGDLAISSKLLRLATIVTPEKGAR